MDFTACSVCGTTIPAGWDRCGVHAAAVLPRPVDRNARIRAMVRLARAHPEEYQRLMADEPRLAVRRRPGSMPLKGRTEEGTRAIYATHAARLRAWGRLALNHPGEFLRLYEGEVGTGAPPDSEKDRFAPDDPMRDWL